jgi:hypothetical protein
MTSPIQPRHSPEAEMARKVKLSQQMAKDWNKVFDSICGADPALALRAKPASRLGASRFDQGERKEVK